MRLLPIHCRTHRGRQGGARQNRNKCFKGLLRSQEEIDTGFQHQQHYLRADPTPRCFWWGKKLSLSQQHGSVTCKPHRV